MSEHGQAPRPSVPADLLPCDLALLKLLACGRPASVAAEQLGMTMAAVAARLQHLREHYGVRSTAAALREAATRGHL